MALAVSTICQPYQVNAPQNATAAAQLNISSHRATPAGRTLRTISGRTWLSVRTRLTGHDHDRPDQEVDHDLFRIADRLVRKEVARQHLPKSDGERRQAEHTDDRLLGAIPRLPHHGGLPSPQSTAASSAETAETISEEIFDSFAT